MPFPSRRSRSSRRDGGGQGSGATARGAAEQGADAPPPPPSARARARHGRGGRSLVTGAHLPPVHTRRDLFETTVRSSADYLQDLWPDELATLRIEVLPMPDQPIGVRGVARWRVLPEHSLVVLYRIPIERMSRLHRDDDWHRRLMIESCVFRAVGELIGKDPWDLAPDRFRHW